MQMAALRQHLPGVACVCLDGTFPASGPTDPVVAAIYKDMDYYEWHEHGEKGYIKAVESTSRVIDCMSALGPFAGIMGFSQGGAMVTRVLRQLAASGDLGGLRFAILIGGVPPRDAEKRVRYVG